MTATSPKTDNRARQSLRLDQALWTRIDRARLQRPGNVSRNTWIAEAILEKLEREGTSSPAETGEKAPNV